MAEKDLYQRRWFQFGIRSLFALMTVVAIVSGFVVHARQCVRHRKIVLGEIRQSFGQAYVAWPKEQFSILSVWRFLGDSPVVEIALIPDTSEAKLTRVQAAFPEANVYIATSAGFFGVYGKPEVY